ncbi:MAG: glycosyltransferase [Armatimonadetes bacterium]|nr:glycosyltransferase [Armatimonadota bacterium]
MFGQAILDLTQGFGADLGCGDNPLPTATHLVDCGYAIEQWRDTKQVHLRDINKGFDDWPTDHFDFIFSRNLVEMLADPLAFLNTCHRVTRPGGRLIIGTLTRSAIQDLLELNDIPYDTLRDESGFYFIVDVGEKQEHPLLSVRPSRRKPFRERLNGNPWPIIVSPPSRPTYEKLSIVIAFYNHGDMTADCVESIFADCPDCEIILVDNGSDAQTKEILRTRLGDRVKFIDLGENQGCAKAWNAGLNQATGDLLSVMNNDILVHSGGITTLATSAWNVGISCFMSGVLNTDLSFSRSIDTSCGATYPEGSALFFRRDVLEKVGLFDEGMEIAYCEDSEWGLRARLNGFNWATCPNTLTHFGQRTSSELVNCQWFHARNQERLFLKYRDRGVGEKIVVQRSGAVGDVLMSTLALRELRRQKPLAHIQLVAEPDSVAFLQSLDCVDSVAIDIAQDYTSFLDLDGAYERPLAQGYWIHPVHAYADIMGINVPTGLYSLPDTSQLADWAREQLQSVSEDVLVALIMRSKTRSMANWSEKKWVELVKMNPGLTFVLIDPDRQPCLDAKPCAQGTESLWAQPNVLDMTGQTPSIFHMLEILRHCTACVSVDTASAHIASAIPLPTVILFGGAAGWARAPLEGKFRLIQGIAPCYPCRNLGPCPRMDGPHCLEPISAEQVTMSLREVLFSD